jgi:hypothetical protein
MTQPTMNILNGRKCHLRNFRFQNPFDNANVNTATRIGVVGFVYGYMD